jgi:predicted RNA-binding protein with PIN domain
MHLLVDGHNLIGQIPGISLADPDDEAKLVMLLRGYATRKRGRQVVVVFDHGVYGHPHRLDGYGVTCHFAKSPQDADTQLIRRLRALRRTGEWALISSDRRVTSVADERGVEVIGAREFAERLLAPAAPAQAPAEKPEAPLSDAEIDEWLHIFGEPAEQGAEQPPAKIEHPPPQTSPKKRKRRRR